MFIMRKEGGEVGEGEKVGEEDNFTKWNKEGRVWERWRDKGRKCEKEGRKREKKKYWASDFWEKGREINWESAGMENR